MTDERLESLSEFDRMTFHAIGREYKELMDKEYINGASIPHVGARDEKWGREPWLDSPAYWSVPPYIRKLHDLMGLCEIPNKDLVEIFSIWDVNL